MQIIQTFIDNLFLIEVDIFNDSRGKFIKTIHSEIFSVNGLDSNFKESFFSISGKNVIRGMHFQTPPQEHNKLVSLIKGRIIDVVLDIRRESTTYGKYFSIELNSLNRKSLYIGSGLAHGFVSLEDDTIVEYHTTTVHSAKSESGILYNSFGFDWNIDNPIISERDLGFLEMKHFDTPFI